MRVLIISLSILLLTVYNANSQQTIKLVTGKSIDGSLIKIIDKVVTFKFLGTELSIKQDEIASIIFNNPLTNSSLENQIVVPKKESNVRLKGIVTYSKFRSSGKELPDIGSTIYLASLENIEKAGYKIEEWKKCQSASKAVLARNVLQLVPNNSTSLADLKELNLDSKAKYDAFISKFSIELPFNSATAKAKKSFVNGNGEFEIEIPEGTYFIFIESKNAGIETATKNFYGRVINLENDTISSFSHSFTDYGNY